MPSPTQRGATTHGFQRYRPFFITIFGTRWGFEYSRVGRHEQPYLDRYILYAFGGTLRLHKFWRGDDDTAPHDHPWWFITFPFTSYYEKIEAECEDLIPGALTFRLVKRFRFHYRPAYFQHIVYGREPFNDPRIGGIYRKDSQPFWTLVITGGVSNTWGFWPTPDKFVPYREWDAYCKERNL